MISVYVDVFSPKGIVYCYKNFLQETLLGNQPSDQEFNVVWTQCVLRKPQNE